MLLTEFDLAKTSAFNPCDVVGKAENLPKIGVTCFSDKLLNTVVEAFKGQIVAHLPSSNGSLPVYAITYKEKEFAFFKSKVGGPACAIAYEEITEMGLEKLVMFGSCGVLQKEIEDLAIIIPTSAIRDEGTSYHYAPAGDEISVNEKYRDAFVEILEKHNYSFVCGKTWTTDAPYRETQAKVAKRKADGALCVEMECASMAAVSQFRNKDFFQFLYAADNLDSTKWDRRSLGCAENLSQKERIALLAFEMAWKMSELG